uniref:Uncharacterized protein n=1 Tax=Lygus hesperus TaxID=30085 RepID=A0A0K8T8H7_LYGHE
MDFLYRYIQLLRTLPATDPDPNITDASGTIRVAFGPTAFVNPMALGTTNENETTFPLKKKGSNKDRKFPDMEILNIFWNDSKGPILTGCWAFLCGGLSVPKEKHRNRSDGNHHHHDISSRLEINRILLSENQGYVHVPTNQRQSVECPKYAPMPSGIIRV